MTVNKYNPPTQSTDTFPEYKDNIDTSIRVLGELAANFAPRESDTPAMTVTLESGKLMNGATFVSQALQTTTTITAPSVNPRIDRIYIDTNSGAFGIITGAENASPVAPAYGVNQFPVCQVALVVSQTTILNTDLIDERPQINLDGSGTVYNITDNSDAIWVVVDSSENAVFTAVVTAVRLIANGPSSTLTNVAIGVDALIAHTTGNGCTAVGYQAGASAIDDELNTAIGYRALTTNQDGWWNVAVGAQALEDSDAASQNVAVGFQALQKLTDGENNTAVGAYALLSNLDAQLNTAVGATSLTNNTTGQVNLALGAVALEQNISGDNNVACGALSLIANETGNQNTVVGSRALENNVSGSGNTIAGYWTARGITTGSGNTIIGAYLFGLDTGLTNNIIIANGSNAGVAASIKAQHDGSNWTLFDGVIIGDGIALATTATDGFLYIPTCAGIPTGVPTAQGATAPMIYDTTNNDLYFYDAGWNLVGGSSGGIVDNSDATWLTVSAVEAAIFTLSDLEMNADTMTFVFDVGSEAHFEDSNGAVSFTMNPEGHYVLGESGEFWSIESELTGIRLYGETFSPFFSEQALTATPTTTRVIDLSNDGSFAELTMGGNTAISFTNIPEAGRACTVTLVLIQDVTGNRVPSFPAGTIWDGGTVPTWGTSDGDEDIITMFTYDAGTTWRANLVGQNYV